MKKKILIFTMMMISMIMTAQVQTRIAVLPFSSEEKISPAVLTYLTEVFTVEMVNSNNFVVVERSKLDAALKEMKFQRGELFDEGSAVELGKMSGAEMVFFGTIFRFGNRNIVSVKGMDIKTATLKYAKQANGDTDVQLEKAVKTIASQISKDEHGVAVGSESSDYDDYNERSSSRNRDRSRNNGRTGRLSRAEQDFSDKWLAEKWCIDADNEEDMRYYYKKHIGGGVALAAVGGTILLSGMICEMMWMGISMVAGIAGIPMLITGAIIAPFCAIPFCFASQIKTIYRKTTGQRLTFLERSTIGGGYDWEKKEVTVAMSIKL